MKKVLIVEDEVDLCSLIAEELRTYGYHVDEAHTGEDGLALAKKKKYDLVITDIRLPLMDGIQMMKDVLLSQTSPKTCFFVMSGFSDYSDEQIFEAGATQFFLKPSGIARLFEDVHAFLVATENIDCSESAQETR